MVRGGVEPPTFRFSGITTAQVPDEAATWMAAAERPRLALVGDVAVTVAVSSAAVRLSVASRAEPEGRSRHAGHLLTAGSGPHGCLRPSPPRPPHNCPRPGSAWTIEQRGGLTIMRLVGWAHASGRWAPECRQP